MIRSILIGLSVLAVSGFARNGKAQDEKPTIYDGQQLPAPVIAPVRPKPIEKSQPSPARVARLPKGRPPEHASAIVQDGELIVERFSFEDATFEDVAEFKEDGEVTKERVIRFGTACLPGTTIYKPVHARAFIGEKEVGSDRLPALLEKPTHVLISADGKNIDRFYREVLKDDCIVLVLPDPTTRIISTGPDVPIGGNPPGEVQFDYPGFDADKYPLKRAR